MARLLPGSAKPWAGALYTASDGKAEPQKAAPAIAAAARRHGATILTDCAARGIETAAGRVAAVVTEKGRIACQSVVLAGGAWSRLFCGNLGVELPQLKVLGSVMRTERLDGGPEISASGGLFGYRKRMDGGYTVATLGVRTIDIVPDSFRLLPRIPAERPAALEEAALPGRPALRRGMAHAAALGARSGHRRSRRCGCSIRRPTRSCWTAPAPASPRPSRRSATSRIAESWGGMIDVMPDAIPVISAVDAVPGFFIATGFSGHGFGIGPGAGRLMADMVMGAPTIVDPAPFRLSRFTDGSNPQPHPLAS